MSEAQETTNTNQDQPNETWFSSWFDTPYYHILYKERNDKEAQLFMDNLTHYLNLPEKAKVLDLACGKGRHSIYLNQLGFDHEKLVYPFQGRSFRLTDVHGRVINEIVA